jgi:hypothetical protein
MKFEIFTVVMMIMIMLLHTNLHDAETESNIIT